MQVGTYTCGDDACAETWTDLIPPLWVPAEDTPHCPCGERGWLVEALQIVPATDPPLLA